MKGSRGLYPTTVYQPFSVVILFLGAICLSLMVGVLTYQGKDVYIPLLVLSLFFFCLICRKPEYGVMVFITTFLLDYPEALRGSGMFTINNLMGVLFSVLLVVKVVREQDLWFLKCRQIQILLAIGIIFILTTSMAEITGDFPAQSMVKDRDFTHEWFFDFASRFAFLLFLANFILTRDHIKGVILILLACAVLIDLSAIQIYFAGTKNDFRATSFLGYGQNANRLAFMSVLGISILWYFIRSLKDKGIKLLVYPLSLVFTLAVLLSASRSGFLCLIFFLLLVLFDKNIYLKKRIGTTLFVIMLVMFIMPYISKTHIERITNIYNPLSQVEGRERLEGAKSAKYRLETLNHSMQIFFEYPITGVGLGNFRLMHQKFYRGLWGVDWWKPPHNSFLWAAVEGGIFCLFLYVLLFFVTWQDLKKISRTKNLQFMARFVQIYLGIFLFYSLFADIWLEVHLYIIVGLTIALKRIASLKGNPPPISAIYKRG